MSDEEREEKELDLSSAEVVTKYKTAAEIVNSVFLTLFNVLGLLILSRILVLLTLDTIFSWDEVQIMLYLHVCFFVNFNVLFL